MAQKLASLIKIQIYQHVSHRCLYDRIISDFDLIAYLQS